jgi:shikimate kinase
MQSVVLIGAPGSGKSTVGKLLAEHLNVAFVDTDSVIEAKADMSISDIFLNHDEKYFRKLERECVASTLEDAVINSVVISLGGGSILDPETQKGLEAFHVIWLQVPIGEAMKRVGMNQARPLLLGNVRANMIKLLEQRTPIYASLANTTIETSQLTPKECVDQILMSSALDATIHERNDDDSAN